MNARDWGDPTSTPAVPPYLDQRYRIATTRLLACAAAAILLSSYSLWGNDSLLGAVLKSIGQCLVMAAALGRLWSTLYIGGRKNVRLITTGPYAASRNPLYLFSTIGAFGAGLVFESIAVAVFLGGSICLRLRRTAIQEAELLRRNFGSKYVAYAETVPLLWPRWSLYNDIDEPSFNPRILGRALRDTVILLLVLPAVEFVEYARDAGFLPSFIPLF